MTAGRPSYKTHVHYKTYEVSVRRRAPGGRGRHSSRRRGFHAPRTRTPRLASTEPRFPAWSRRLWWRRPLHPRRPPTRARRRAPCFRGCPGRRRGARRRRLLRTRRSALRSRAARSRATPSGPRRSTGRSLPRARARRDAGSGGARARRRAPAPPARRRPTWNAARARTSRMRTAPMPDDDEGPETVAKRALAPMFVIVNVRFV